MFAHFSLLIVWYRERSFALRGNLLITTLDLTCFRRYSLLSNRVFDVVVFEILVWIALFFQFNTVEKSDCILKEGFLRLVILNILINKKFDALLLESWKLFFVVSCAQSSLKFSCHRWHTNNSVEHFEYFQICVELWFDASNNFIFYFILDHQGFNDLTLQLFYFSLKTDDFLCCLFYFFLVPDLVLIQGVLKLNIFWDHLIHFYQKLSRRFAHSLPLNVPINRLELILKLPYFVP